MRFFSPEVVTTATPMVRFWGFWVVTGGTTGTHRLYRTWVTPCYGKYLTDALKSTSLPDRCAIIIFKFTETNITYKYMPLKQV